MVKVVTLCVDATSNILAQSVTKSTSVASMEVDSQATNSLQEFSKSKPSHTCLGHNRHNQLNILYLPMAGKLSKLG